jgi:hypothetical protein
VASKPFGPRSQPAIATIGVSPRGSVGQPE